MNTTDLDYDADDGEGGDFLKKNWLALTVGALVLAGGTSAAIALSSRGGSGTRKAPDITMVQIIPPAVVLPPPPPPPPVEEEVLEHEEEVPEEAPADAGPSTNVTSNGPPDAFRLPKKGSKPVRMLGRGRSVVSTWAPYAGQAASRIADAMRRHHKLKHSTMSITARVWIDSTGRITRATTQSTGDPEMDTALRDEILSGLQLSGPPPEGMKMPVNLKVTARRPN